MVSRTTKKFWQAYKKLDETVQEQARSAYRLFRKNPLMDRLEHYRQSIKKLLKEYADSIQQNPELGVEVELIFDSEHDRYLLLNVGWKETIRIHNCIFHFDIKDGKIWLQENNTDVEIDQEFEEMGISKQEIVIGFHHPSMRKYSDYAIA